jgi:hypothetical protein
MYQWYIIYLYMRSVSYVKPVANSSTGTTNKAESTGTGLVHDTKFSVVF